MTRLFADTSYYLALLNADDELHELALATSSLLRGEALTTTWVWTERADALSRPTDRVKAVGFIRDLLSDERIIILSPTEDLFQSGLELYADRPDKDWSLTDCISFVAMEDEGLSEALTADHHFEQAGFTILMK